MKVDKSSLHSVIKGKAGYTSGNHVHETYTPSNPHFYIVKVGYKGVYLFFLFLLQNIDYGYSLEPPRTKVQISCAAPLFLLHR